MMAKSWWDGKRTRPDPREFTAVLVAPFRQYPFVTVTAPRQAGKTTLCGAGFPGLPYVDLDAPDERAFAESDPRGFLARFPEGAILDEIQRVLDLLSYLKVLADDDGGAGQVATGSALRERGRCRDP